MSEPAPPARSRDVLARSLPARLARWRGCRRGWSWHWAAVRRRGFLASLGALALPASPGLAQGDGVDQIVRAEMGQRHIPGVSLAVVRDGAIVKSAAYGRMRLSPDEPASPTTIYKLDSVTKQFTASGLMLLVQGGQVRPATSARPRRSHRAPEGGGRKPNLVSTACPSRPTRTSMNACATARCRAAATTAAG